MSIRALDLELERNLSPGSRDQRLDSRRTERNMQIYSGSGQKGDKGKVDVAYQRIPVIRTSGKRRHSVPRPLLSSALLLGLGSAQNILHRFCFSLFAAAAAA